MHSLQAATLDEGKKELHADPNQIHHPLPQQMKRSTSTLNIIIIIIIITIIIIIIIIIITIVTLCAMQPNVV